MKRIRLWAVPALLLLAGFSGGCVQRVFMTESDANITTTTLLEGMQARPDLVAQPLTEITAPPPTLNNLEREIRYLSLPEAIAIALESGRVGQPSLLFPGTALDNLVQFTGQGVSGSDAIRAFAIDTARIGAGLEASLTKFDAVFTSSLTWTTNDQAIGEGRINGQRLVDSVNGSQFSSQQANFSSGVLKPLSTGGAAGITFNLPYQFTRVGTFNPYNPSYQPQLQFQFEQPLLQGFGTEINQLRAAHPGSLLTPGVINTQPTSEGILITRLRFDQQRAEFERNVHQMLLNVETAYWNLYASYWQLYSREQGLRFAFEAFRLAKLKLEAGRANAGDFYQTRGQYEQFRAQRLQAIDQILENERQLRGLLGIPIEDGKRLMPSDSPTLSPYLPDWKTALSDCLTKRPELYMARQDVKAAQLRLILAKNSLLPDLRFTSTYDVNGAGTRLDGASGSNPIVGDQAGRDRDVNAFRSMSENRFNNWSAGLRLNVPIGYRFAYTQVRQAQLDLARSLEVLKDNELKAQSFLYSYYKRLSLNYEQIRANRATREAYGEQLRVRQQEYQAGRGTLDVLLEAQRFWADALNSEYQSIRDYNNALVGFEFSRGTIKEHDNVVIAEGALPQATLTRAKDHYEARTKSFVLRERAMPQAVSPATPATGGHVSGAAVTIPAYLAATPEITQVPELPRTHYDIKPGTPAAPIELPGTNGTPEVLPVRPKPLDNKPAAEGKDRPAKLPKRSNDFGSVRTDD